MDLWGDVHSGCSVCVISRVALTSRFALRFALTSRWLLA